MNAKLCVGDLVRACRVGAGAGANAGACGSGVDVVRGAGSVDEVMPVVLFFWVQLSFVGHCGQYRSHPPPRVKEYPVKSVTSDMNGQSLLMLSGTTGLKLCLKVCKDSDLLVAPGARFFCDLIELTMSKLLKGIDYFMVLLPPWHLNSRSWFDEQRELRSYLVSNVGHGIGLELCYILTESAYSMFWSTPASTPLFGLLRRWSMPQWFCKITKSGDLVTSLNDSNLSHSKRPYERILIARKIRKESITSLDVSSEDCEESVGSNIEPPEGKVLCSVPSGMHSHKPYLGDLLVPYVKDGSASVDTEVNCLELFARSLNPGWTSYGKEVLKLQHTCLFNKSSC
ncbi:unnamed protein product [Meganyctiphanes norvegica]|uniref:Uncharacterized protein n=1 Tax=Meganyctiphanes norvegica TaxID=48144 RepID=A0AAV2SRB7_MEGNR